MLPLFKPLSEPVHTVRMRYYTTIGSGSANSDSPISIAGNIVSLTDFTNFASTFQLFTISKAKL
jgi:hypothetical protein